MAVYSIFFRDSVRKDLESLAKNDLRRIIERIGSLAEDPRPVG